MSKRMWFLLIYCLHEIGLEWQLSLRTLIFWALYGMRHLIMKLDVELNLQAEIKNGYKKILSKPDIAWLLLRSFVASS